MKITIDIPDETLCMFCNYVFYTATGLTMNVKSLETDDLYDGNEIKLNPHKGGEKDG